MCVPDVVLLSNTYNAESEEINLPSDDSTLLSHTGTCLALFSAYGIRIRESLAKEVELVCMFPASSHDNDRWRNSRVVTTFTNPSCKRR